MQNLKVKVNSVEESKEAQELFFSAGCSWGGLGGQCIKKLKFPSYVAYSGKFILTDQLDNNFSFHKAKEITIPQLKDMVVLNRNDPKDANVYQVDVPCLYDLYLASDNNLYFFYCGKGWKLSNLNDDEDYRKLLKPIQNNDLPFIDSEESLNDKIASAEEARQKHSHYKKDVSHLGFIDVYRVLSLFEVESHAVGHAIKKLLCSGQRGAKDKAQDIQEEIDSLNRELDMMREDESNG